MTARPINPGELLDLADKLARRGSGPGRPRTVELRRAVSSAYYALFHELTWRGTEPSPHPDLVRLGDAFSTLQDERHRADYDDYYDLTKALTLALLDGAREAVALSVALTRRTEPTYEIFLRLMLSASQAKTRSS